MMESASVHPDLKKKKPLEIEDATRVEETSFQGLLTLFIAAYTAVFMVLYSGMGVGPWLHIAANRHAWASSGLFMGSIFAIWILIVFDGFTGGHHFFEHKGRVLVVVIAILAGLIGIVVGIDGYPYGPFCLYVFFLAPIIAVLPHYLAYGRKKGGAKKMPFFRYLPRLVKPLLFVGIVYAFAWLVWTSKKKNRWSKARERYGERLRRNGFACRRTREENWMDDEDIDSLEPFGTCTEVFLIWVLPWIAAWALLVFAVVVKVIANEGHDHEEDHDEEEASALVEGGQNRRKHGASRKRKPNRVALALMLLLIGAWVAASLAGAGHGIGTAIFASVIAAAIGMAFAACYAFGFKGLFDRLNHSSAIQENMEKYYLPYADAWRGLAVVCTGPLVLLFYLPTVFVKQRVRSWKQRIRSCLRCCCYWCYSKPATKSPREGGESTPNPMQQEAAGEKQEDDVLQQHIERVEDERLYWLTKEARKQWASVAEWNWTRVLFFATVVGLANIAVVVVVAKFTVLVMSYVVVACEELSVFAATMVIVGVGLFLFLLPPVPGAPIYLAAGVLLVAVCRSKGWPVIMGILYTASVSLGIKLCACTMQQKLIGEPLARSLWVRKTVGINSDLIRCTRLVLADKGLTVGKVALLVGGPDWPTSVLCGILKLPLLPVLLGTTPVWFLIWPTCLGGAFLIIDEPTSQVLSTIFVGLAALVQSGSLVVAGIQLRAEQHRRKDAIAEIPLDPEVEAVVEHDQRRRELYLTKTHWRNVPGFWRFVLVTNVILLTFACWVTTCYPSACFREFAVDDRVSKRLQGNWTRIIKPLGLVALVSTLLSFILFSSFELLWARHQVTASDLANLPSSSGSVSH